ncbi:polysaccharide biosynthesis/export family protein [Collimonas sp.]|uniref:polysaccharide biosynthesis/export family protein n=1 Tax=Collimonas sp. TaxID=1963772 RepID=UPI002C08CA75|nr:polysaccharide biosynthesis/export family protein [Collimonas sp.]HWX01947.1 polysaccharide biosynthesis/export family protein [Collimonas sp.]
MSFNLKKHLRRWAALASLFLLAACVTVPGMRMEQSASEKDGGHDATSFTTITPDLVRQEKAVAQQRSGPDLTPLMKAPAPYLIGNGDILSIIVWDHPELAAPAMAAAQAAVAGIEGSTAPGFVVDQSGMVQFPYVGMLKLAGLTEAQARDALTAKLGQYFRKPNLTLRVQAYRSQRVYLSGEVKTPGIQAINDIPMTLAEALSRAGGVLEGGDASQVEVTRNGANYRVNLPLLIRRGMGPSGGILLANGDAVRVFARDDSKVFVLGEVTRPLTLTLRDGRMTLSEALGEAGGLSPLTSDARQVYVVRNAAGDTAQPQVYHLDARSPAAFALANNFQLKARDVVYVDAAPLALWSRVVSLIIPSAQSVTSAVQAGK